MNLRAILVECIRKISYCVRFVARPLWQRKFDKKYGPTWHCVVGSDFKAHVSHESKHFIFFYIGKTAICLFKSG